MKIPVSSFTFGAWRLRGKQIANLIIIAFLTACASSSDCDLCGRWKSNAEKTLVEMERSPLLSDEQRAFYRNDFFGRLIVETKPTVGRAYFEDENPDDSPWEPWQVTSRSGNHYKTRSKNVKTGEWKEYSVTIEGACYKVDQPQLGFSEWFCRQQ